MAGLKAVGKYAAISSGVLAAAKAWVKVSAPKRANKILSAKVAFLTEIEKGEITKTV
jgi:hypothetical protein